MKIYRSLEDNFKFKNAVVTVGIFDGVHRGHQHLINRLNEIAKENDGESVVITFDPLPIKFFNPNMEMIELTTLEEKLKLLETYGVDNVIVIPFNKEFTEITAEQYIEEILIGKIGVHTFLSGPDHVFGKDRKGNITLLNQYKCSTPGVEHNTCFYVEQIDPLSDLDGPINSTRIRAARMLGQEDKVQELLGHD